MVVPVFDFMIELHYNDWEKLIILKNEIQVIQEILCEMIPYYTGIIILY